MAMAMSCAHLNVLGPSVIATEVKSCCRCSNAASPSFSFRVLRTRYGGRSRSLHRSLVCQASGSRRDKEKRRGEAKQDGGKLEEQLNSINDDTEYEYEEIVASEDGNDEEEDYDANAEVRIPLPEDEAAMLSPEVARNSYVGDKYERSLGDRTATATSAAAGAAGVSRDDPNVRRAQASGKLVGDEFEDIREEGEESARIVAGEARDAADASGKRIQKAGRRVGQNLDEVRKAGESALGGSADVVEEQAGRAAENIQEGLEEAGDAALDVLGIGEESAEAGGQRLQERGKNVTEDVEAVGKEGQKVAARAGRQLTKQIRETSKELGPEAEEAEQEAERAVRSTFRRAQQSAERVQEPIEKAVSASMDAAAAIGDEVLKLGDSIVEAVEDATGVAVPVPRAGRRFRTSARQTDGDDDGDGDGEQLVGGKYKPAGKTVARRYQGASPTEDDGEAPEADGRFADSTVLVAGAAGATGRLIVQNLVGKGVTVRALVRNVYKARNLKQLQGAELFEADLYNYESVKEAISGSNVVICAVGARGFDLLQAYRTEYEGVLNLISAAKNQGDVKKFVLITTIGVNYLQIVPLLYWKRQAELFLQRSGMNYTIVRPAGLTGDRGGDRVELRPADSLFMGAVSRKKVAEVCVSALVTPSASEKTVEVLGGSGRVRRSIADQFDSV